VRLTKDGVQELLLRVELLLVSKNIPKEKFYAESGISSASFSQWKSGKYAPSVNAIYKMANYLGVSAEYLMGIDDAIPQEVQKEKLT